MSTIEINLLNQIDNLVDSREKVKMQLLCMQADLQRKGLTISLFNQRSKQLESVISKINDTIDFLIEIYRKSGLLNDEKEKIEV